MEFLSHKQVHWYSLVRHTPSYKWEEVNAMATELLNLRARLEEVEREREEWRARVYSHTCKICGDHNAALHCVHCGRPFARPVGVVRRSYDEMEYTAQALAAALVTLRTEAEYLETFSEYGSTNARAIARKIRAALAAAQGVR